MATRKNTRTAPSTPTRAVGYVRISQDRPGETSTGTQEERIRAHCVAQGWDVVEIVVEPGRSAYKSSRSTRPGFRRALELVRAGAADAFVVWKLDRAARNALDLLGFVQELEADGGRFASVTESFDTSTAMGRAMLTMLAAIAELESAQKTERQLSWHHDRAVKGATPTGPRPFGYRRERNRLYIDEAEAAVIRRAADRVLTGGSEGSLRAILRDLDAAGVVGKDGRPFNRRGLRFILTGPTVAACREPEPGVFVGSDDWEPILDRATWDEVRAILSDPSRRTGLGNGRRWLLTGIAACGRCAGDVRMIAKPHPSGPRYSCPSCHLSIEAARTDELLERDLLALLDPKAWRRLHRSRPSDSDHAGFEQAMAALTARFVVGDIDATELAAYAEDLRRRQEAKVAPVVPLPDVNDLRKAWPKFTIEAKRLVLSAATESLTIKPWTPGVNRFDETRVDWVPVF